MEPPRWKYRLRKTSSEHGPWADAQILQNWCFKNRKKLGVWEVPVLALRASEKNSYRNWSQL